MKTLCIDAGNSNIKYGIFENDELIESSIIALENILHLADKHNFPPIAVSSVVPSVSDKLKNIFSNKNIFFINHTSKFNLLINYDTPETLGMDRICSAEGAFYLHKKMNKSFNENEFIISSDFGTALTLNFVKHPNTFLGGMIAPGINTMFNSLYGHTAQLPAASLKDFSGVIGKSTKQSIASGVINSAAGLLERANQYLTDHLSSNRNYFYITGGASEYITDKLSFNFVHERSLVLYGIYSIANKNLL